MSTCAEQTRRINNMRHFKSTSEPGGTETHLDGGGCCCWCISLHHLAFLIHQELAEVPLDGIPKKASTLLGPQELVHRGRVRPIYINLSRAWEVHDYTNQHTDGTSASLHGSQNDKTLSAYWHVSMYRLPALSFPPTAGG